MNLQKETIDFLKENGKTFNDVVWIGSKDVYLTTDQWVELSDFDYDNGYGGQEVAPDLTLVGEDWYIERSEYDGSEMWAFKTLPAMPNKRFKGDTLNVVYSYSLLELSNGEDK